MENGKLEEKLFLYGLIGMPIVILICVIYRWLITRFNLQFLDECQLLRLFGIYCPGCGGTRAVRYLMKGDILASIYYHPVVFYGVALYIVFMISHLLKNISKGKIKGMQWHNTYIYIAVSLIVFNFVFKNIA